MIKRPDPKKPRNKPRKTHRGGAPEKDGQRGDSRVSRNRDVNERRTPEAPPHKSRMKRGKPQHDEVFLYGLHAVRAALLNPNRIKNVMYATPNALARLGQDVVERSGVPIELAESKTLDALVSHDAVHQGTVLVCAPLVSLDASELFHLADKQLILVLDQITDPHNVGAILRTATAFAVDAVIMTHRNSALETGALAKSASGALDMIPIIDVRNLSKAIEELNAMGFMSFGLDSEGPLILEETLKQTSPSKAVLVLGSEGKGLRQQTRQACTHLARLDMPGAIKSLNVSNAAALSLYVVGQELKNQNFNHQNR